MRNILFFGLSICCLFISNSCSDQNMLVIEESPFQKFLGDWILESETINGVPVNEISYHLIHIEEDSNTQDSIAIGYYQKNNPAQNQDLTIELTENKNELILRNWAIFICQYEFLDVDRFQLTDVFESDSTTVIGTWVRQE